MKTALKIISATVATLLLVGIFTKDGEGTLSHAFPAGMLAFAFIWVPFFLFYRYDQKQIAKEEAMKNAETGDSED